MREELSFVGLPGELLSSGRLKSCCSTRVDQKVTSARVREKVAGRSVVKVVIEVPQTRSSRVWRWAETIDKLSLSSEQGQGERARQTHTPRHFGTYCTGSSRASSFTHSLTLDTSTIHPRLGLGIALRGAGPTASIIPLSSWRD